MLALPKPSSKKRANAHKILSDTGLAKLSLHVPKSRPFPRSPDCEAVPQGEKKMVQKFPSEGTDSCCGRNSDRLPEALQTVCDITTNPPSTCTSECFSYTTKRKQKTRNSRGFCFASGPLVYCLKIYLFPLCSFIFFLLSSDSPISHDTMTKKNAC